MKNHHTPEREHELFEKAYQKLFLDRKKRYGLKKALVKTGQTLCGIGVEEVFAVEMFKSKLPAENNEFIEYCIKKGYYKTLKMLAQKDAEKANLN